MSAVLHTCEFAFVGHTWSEMQFCKKKIPKIAMINNQTLRWLVKSYILLTPKVGKVHHQSLTLKIVTNVYHSCNSSSPKTTITNNCNSL